MLVNYSDSKVITDKPSIFLAGPTSRGTEKTSWRQEALEILKTLGFKGIVYYPEIEDKVSGYDYTTQTEWERKALYSANIIIFWIPRKLPEHPAFTTNVEFGYWMAKEPQKVLYGRPDNSQKNKYLDWLYTKETEKTPVNNLQVLLEEAVLSMHM